MIQTTNVEPSAPEHEEQGAHLRDYWRIVWRHRWTVAAIFLGVALMSGIYTFLQTPIYRATATVEAQTQSRRALSGPDVSGLGASGFGWAAEERFYSTQIEIIRSHDLAARVINRLGLRGDPMFAKASDPALILSQMVQPNMRKDTGILEISITGADPKRAAEFANAFAHEYVNRNFDMGSDAVKRMVYDMANQLEPIKKDIEKADKKRLGLGQIAELYVPENQKTILESNMKKFSDALSDSQIEIARLEGTLSEIKAIEANQGDPLTIKQISEDPTVKLLAENRTGIERELAVLRVKFREGAPEVKQRLSEMARVQDRLDERIHSIVGAIEAEYELKKRTARAMEAYVQANRKESYENGQKASEYEIAKGEVEIQRKAYEAFLQAVKQVSLQANLLNNNLTLLDEAVVPTAPIRPRTRMNLLMGTMVGLLLGVGAAFFIDYFDNTIKSTDDIEQILRLHLLSVIPRYRETTGHAVKEAYQTLRTSVLFSSKGRQHKLLLITSAGPREGKTSTIVNLARTIASAGERVVVLDCDLRRPKVHEDLAVERDHGLTNYLAGIEAGSYQELLKPTSLPTLFALTCGPIPPNPPELFGTQRFRDLLAYLRRDFDWVLIDSPPVASLTDAVILASLVDMVAFVVKHNQNDRDLIRRCVANIRNVNPNIIGAVLNNVDIERAGADYYYAGYYYYYAAEGERKSRRRARRDRERQAREKVGAVR